MHGSEMIVSWTLVYSSVANSTYLHASSMSEVQRIKLESQMIIGVYHLMRHGVFHMSSISELVRAQQDAELWVETTALLCSAALNTHVGLVQVMTEQVDVVSHEAYYGRVFQQPFPVLLCTLDIALLVDLIFDVEVGFSFLGCCASGENGEEGGPCVEVLVRSLRGWRLGRRRLR